MIISKHVHYVNLFNILVVAGLSYWQIDEGNKFPFVILPFLFVLIMLPMNNSLRNKNKQIIKVATSITGIVLLLLIYPSIQVFSTGNQMDITRISLMLFSTILSLVALINCVIKTKNNLI